MFLFRRSRKTSQGSEDSLDQSSTPVEAPAAPMADRRDRDGGPSFRPRDLHEANRLDFQHFLLRQILKGHYVAPVSFPRSILDVGCGTGRWIFDVGQEFPLAQMVGFDIDIPALTERLDARYHFIQGDLLQGLPFSEKSFEFVHQRLLLNALPAASWPPLIKRLIQITLPGGWLELVDATHLITPPGSAGQQVQQWSEQIYRQNKIDPLLAQHLGSMLKASPHLEDVHFVYIDAPVGDWGGRLGSLMAKNYASSYEYVKPLYQHYLRIDSRILNQTFDDMQREWEMFQCTSRIYVAYGRRS